MINEKVQDRKAIIFGRFQPLTKAHYNMIKDVVSKYQEVFVLPVQGSKAYKSSRKTDKGKRSEMAKKMERSPFPVGIRQEMILSAITELDDKHVLKGEAGSIEKIYERLNKMFPKKDFSKIDIFAGADEYESYNAQVERMSEKEEYQDLDINVQKYDEGTRSMGDSDSDVSATQVRSFLTNKDWNEGFEKYKKMIAPPLATREWYDKLREAIMKIQKKEAAEEIRDFFNRLEEETQGL